MTRPRSQAAPCAGAAGAPGGFAPLRHPSFAVLWGATVLGNTGSWMRDVGERLADDRRWRPRR